MRCMITFNDNGIRFTHRIVGIAYDRDRVLLHRAESDDFWALPGGRAELLEPSPQTLVREMQEEIGVEVRVERLVWIAENFFEYQGVQHHEIGFYYLMSLPLDSPLREATEPFFGDEGGIRIIFQWYPVNSLATVRLYPTFLRAGLQALPASITHIIHTDGKDD
jgi:ADP-ribose pyrophosphatase YjhB (NUDIX family)